jgi:proteasome beta subunit
MNDVVKSGTTTIGLICKDGVVLATDKRATTGYLVADKNIRKIYNLTDSIAVTMAGTVSDAQLLLRYTKAELNLKNIRTEQEISVREAANLIARMVYSNVRSFSAIPGVSQFIMGGKDKEGFHLFDIYPDGTVTECEDYVCSGSGSVVAYGVLETLYKQNMSVEDGVKLAVKVLNAALQRDIASGSGIDIVTITKDGFKRVLEKEIETKFDF